MKVREAYAKVEAACPGFFSGMEQVVLGNDVDVVADSFVGVIDTEEKVSALGQLLHGFQVGLGSTSTDDLAWFASSGVPLCQVLLKREEILRSRRGATPSMLASLTPEHLSEAVDLGVKMRAYADACRFLLGTLYQRAHVVEHHWNDMPLA